METGTGTYDIRCLQASIKLGAFYLSMKEDEKMEKKYEELQTLCEPLIKYLEKKYDPYTTIVISDKDIKLVRTEIGIEAK